MRQRLTGAEVGRLATVNDASGPHLVPCCFALDGEVVYSAVDHKPKSTTALRRLANLRANPAASLLVDHYDGTDWSALWWIRVDGKGRVIDDPAERDRAVAALVAKYPQYAAHPPAGPAIAIEITTWRAWP